MSAGWLIVGVGVFVGFAAWLLGRRAQRGVSRQAAQTVEQITSLIEHADCLMWEARVELVRGDWQWKITLHRSMLYRKLFGQRLIAPDTDLWAEFEVPERAEMDVLAREALSHSRSGYEQHFRVIRGGVVMWLHESVSITPVGKDLFRLVGLLTDITAQRQAELTNQASQERLQQLLAHANCMLWQADVTRNKAGEYDWEWFVPRSELYRRMMGEIPDQKAIMPWGMINVPEFSELEIRSRDAMQRGLPGYEQVFRVIQGARVTWMHEQATITPLGADHWKLEGVVMDITAQRNAEEARRASDEQLGKLLEVADCMVWEAVVTRAPDDTLGWSHFMPRSALYRRIFGETKEVRLLWHALNVPELDEMSARALHAVKSRASNYVQEFRVIQPDEVIWLREVVAIKALSSDQFRMVGVITDVSARREAEEARLSSEGRLQKLLTRADCLLWEAAVELAPTSWTWDFEVQDSGFSEKLFGPPTPGYTAGLWRRFNIPEWAEMNQRCRTALEEGRPGYEQIFHIQRDDGTAIWIQETVSIEPLGTAQFSLVGVATDITRQHGAENALAVEKERLAVTLRAMAEGVITTDVTGIIQFMNPAASNLLQWNADAIGQSVRTICVLETDPAGAEFKFPVGEAAREEDAVTELPPRTRLVTRQGQRRYVDGCCAPIHSADSKVTGMVFVFRDVTEHERLEQEVIRATRLESVGVLAGGIAHDFNNILTGVMGNLALAQMDIDVKSDAGARLRDAEKATLRARDLTQQLLTFAKGGEPVRTAVDLDAIVRETATFALHGSNVKAVFHLASDLWPADADKGQIGRVVQNLVINAIQAMPAGGTLRLTAHNEKVSGLNHPGLMPGRYIQIAIADTGEGIKAEVLPRIFDPYFTTKQTGSGLGLAAVYSIIKKHRGHIDVESTIGHGSTFRFWLPAMSGGSVAYSAPPMPVIESHYEGRVLFMDDEEVICLMAVRLLQRLGFAVECAADGAAAVEKFRQARAEGNPFTLVIMDLTVPGGMGGREAIIQLQAIDPQVKAIVSSGYSSDPVLANYRDHGFCGVVAKPYRLEDFVQALRDALPGRSAV